MKKKFLNFAINCIKESHPDYDDIKIAEMRYSLRRVLFIFYKVDNYSCLFINFRSVQRDVNYVSNI